MNNIDELIQQEIKSGNKFKLETYRAIKAEFLKAKTEKNAKELDEVRKLQILQKMIKQRGDSADQYIKANRLDLADDEKAEIAIIAEFLPEEVTKEEIEAAIVNCNIEKTKSNMGSIIKVVKSQFPLADGKLVAKTVKKYLI